MAPFCQPFWQARLENVFHVWVKEGIQSSRLLFLSCGCCWESRKDFRFGYNWIRPATESVSVYRIVFFPSHRSFVCVFFITCAHLSEGNQYVSGAACVSFSDHWVCLLEEPQPVLSRLVFSGLLPPAGCGGQCDNRAATNGSPPRGPSGRTLSSGSRLSFFTHRFQNILSFVCL